jgi:hypothetical protein
MAKKLLPALLILIAAVANAQWSQIGQSVYGQMDQSYFGREVSISDDGTTVAVGTAYGDYNGLFNNGSVSAYRLVNNVWTQIGQTLYGTEGDESMGGAISLSADGNILAVGSEYGNGGLGKVKVFEFINSAWVQKGATMVGTQPFGLFGTDVSISDDGMTLAVARRGFNGIFGAHFFGFNGANYISEGVLGSSGYLFSISLSGDGNFAVFGGQTWMYPVKKENGTWSTISNISVASTGINGGNDFITVSGNGNVWAFGSELNENGGPDAGRVMIIDMTDPDAWIYNIIYGNNFEQIGSDICLNYDGTILAVKNRIWNNIEGTWTLVSTVPSITLTSQLNAAGDVFASGYDGYSQPGLGQVGLMQVFGNLPNTPPSLACPMDLMVDAEQSGCGAAVTLPGVFAIDLEDGEIEAIQTDGIPSGAFFPIGTSIVEFTATDTEGQSVVCSFNVIVTDNTAPTALCNDVTLELNENGEATILAESIDAGSDDNCAVLALSLDLTTFDCDDLGTHEVVLTVADANGNEGTCVSTVTLVDVIAPEAVCSNVTVDLNEDGEATLLTESIDGGSLDNCGIQSMTLDVSSFGCDDLGSHSVELTVVDFDGNQSTCVATVTVIDSETPVAVCADRVVELDEDGAGALLSEDVDGGSSDNCGIASMTIDVASFDCSSIGSQLVELTLTDNAGNESSCLASITVVDVLAPVIICPADEIVEIPLGGSFTVPDYFSLGQATADDNCSNAAGTSQVPVVGATLGLGEHVITLNASDDFGHSTDCSFTITVQTEIGVDEIGATWFQLFPNPANERVMVSFDSHIQGNTVMSIYDISGRKLISQTLSHQSTVDVSTLASGHYIVEAVQGESSSRQVLVIQR